MNQPCFSYSVTDGFLNRHDENGELAARLNIDHIQQVRLSQQRAFQSVQIVCHVTDMSGEVLSFGSMNAIGASSWESSIETFMPLLIVLHRALEPRADRVNYQEGSSKQSQAIMAAIGGLMLTIGGWFFIDTFLLNAQTGGLFLLPVVAAGIWLLSLSVTAGAKPYNPQIYRQPVSGHKPEPTETCDNREH